MPASIEATAEEVPPPPYTSEDPAPAAVPQHGSTEPPDVSNLSVRTSLRGGYTRHRPDAVLDPPPALSSAASYFRERLFHNPASSLGVLQHNVHFDSRLTPTRLPFPHPSGSYLRRDVTGQDWATFVNFLFPAQSEGRKKAGRDGQSQDAIDTEPSEQKRRIQAVIAEWNVGFFAPRHIQIIANFERSPTPQYQEPLDRGVPVPGNEFGSSQAGPSSAAAPKYRRRSGSISSVSSSSSSSSESSVDSIKSKDLVHATIPEIQAVIAAFRADPFKKNHLCKSVKELRRQLRAQHLPFSSSDPYNNSKASKDDKKRFKEDRKLLKKEFKATIKDVKAELQAEKKLRRAARKHRHDARKAEHHNLKGQRREEKRAARDFERGERRGCHSRGQGPPQALFAQPAPATMSGQQPPAFSPQQPPPQPAAARARAADAENRAHATANDMASRDWDAEGKARVREAQAVAEARAQTAQQAAAEVAGRDWGSRGDAGRARGAAAEGRAREVARDWGG